MIVCSNVGGSCLKSALIISSVEDVLEGDDCSSVFEPREIFLFASEDIPVLYEVPSLLLESGPILTVSFIYFYVFFFLFRNNITNRLSNTFDLVHRSIHLIVYTR